MLSRVAESMYWMSRQVERAENLARFIEVTLHMTLDQTDITTDPWKPLVLSTGDQEWFDKNYLRADAQNSIAFLAFDSQYHSSIITSLVCARDNARGVRESMSTQAFEALNDLYHFVRDNHDPQSTFPTIEFFEQITSHATMWTGVLETTMPHDTAWHFLNLGRLLERADKTSRILDVKYFSLLPRLDDVGTAIDDLQWSTLLMAIGGFEAYRREHHLMDIHKIVSFFLFHQAFPRSIYACISGADWSLKEIEKDSGPHSDGEAKRRLTSLRNRLENTNAKEVLDGGMHEFIDRLQTELNEIGECISHDYFNAKTVA